MVVKWTHLQKEEVVQDGRRNQVSPGRHRRLALQRGPQRLYDQVRQRDPRRPRLKRQLARNRQPRLGEVVAVVGARRNIGISVVGKIGMAARSAR